MSAPKRLSAGLLATALAAGGAVVTLDVGPGSSSGELPPPPPLLEMSAPEPILPDDGLERLIVTVPSTVSDGASPVPAPDRPDGMASEDDGLLETLPSEAERIVVRDGQLGYLDADDVFVVFGGDEGGSPEQPSIADGLAALPGVESVEPISDGSFAVRTSEPEQLDRLADLGVTVTEDMFLAFTADPYEPYQWVLDNTGTNLNGISSLPTVSQDPDADIDGVEARLGATGDGVVVAIVDSGVDLSHPDLAHAAWTNPGEDCDSGAGNGVDDDGNGYIDDCSGWDFGDNDRQTFDGSNNPHGTHVAGIVAAASGNGLGVAGVAPDAKIMDLKVSDRWGAIPSSSIAMAIRYAVDNGADVVNLSLGSQPGAPLESAAEMAGAVEYARVNGVLLVVAAGNNGVSLDSAPVYPASLNTSNMIVVGATDPTDHSTSFSNFGSALDLFAPGLYILSTTPNGQFGFQSGTSQASPAVAGAAALAVESLGTSSPSAVIDRLTASADSLPNLHGKAANPLRVNAARAVGVAVGAVGTPDGAGDAGGSAGSVGSVTVRGLSGDETGRVSASIAIAVEDEALDEPFQWEASLFAIEQGRNVFALTDHEVLAGPPGEAQPVLTDERGSVVLAEATDQSAEWGTVLPGGTYALLIEAVPERDPDLRLGDGFLATFVVAGPGDESTDDGTGSDSGDAGDGSGSGTDDGSSGDSTGAGSGSGSGADDAAGDSGAGSGSDSGSGGGSSAGDSSGGSTGGSTTGSTGGGSGGGSGSGGSGTGSSADPGGSGGSSGGGSTGGSTGGSAGGSTGGGTDPGTGGGSTGGAPGDTTGGSTDGSSEPGVGSGSGSNGDWAVLDISPQIGFVDTFNLVHVFGTFNEPVTVWFGDSAARTISHSERLLIVQTERRAQPGVVDVSLRRQSEEVLRLPQAYSFVDPDGSGGGGFEPDPGGGSVGSGGGDTGGVGGGDTGGSTSDPGTGGGTGDGTGEGTGGDLPSDDGSGGSGSGGDSSGDDGSTDDGSDDGGTGGDGALVGGREPTPRHSVDGDPTELANGLIGVPVQGINITGPIPSCGVDPCRARRV